MKVKVTRADKGTWYYECVGMTFEVEDQPASEGGITHILKEDPTRGISSKNFEIVQEQTVQNSNSKYNNVTKPLHYHENGLDPLTVMKYTFTKEQRVGFAKGNALKYLMRYDKKNGAEDLRKLAFYVNELIELEGE